MFPMRQYQPIKLPMPPADMKWSRKPTELVDCAACNGTGLRQVPRNDGSLLCRGCNGSGKQRV